MIKNIIYIILDYTRRLPLIILICVLISCNQAGLSKKKPRCIQGVLSLEDWDFDKDGPLELSGEWEFYWKRFISPAKINSRDEFKTGKSYYHVPEIWNRYSNSTNKPVGNFGYATYILLIKGLAKNKKLSLFLGDAGTSYRAFISPGTGADTADDFSPNPLLSNGIVSSEANKSIPQYIPLYGSFKTGYESYYIIFQVSNFAHRMGGLWGPVTLGLESEIAKTIKYKQSLQFIILGILLAMSIHYFLFFYQRRIDMSSLFFSLFCFSIALRLITTERLIPILFFPEPDKLIFEITNKIEYISAYLALPLFFNFLHSLYPDEFSKKLKQALWYISAGFIFFTLVLKINIYSYLMPYYQLLIILTNVYMVVSLFIAARRHEKGSVFSLFGYSAIFAAVINDILRANEVVSTPYLLPYGLLLFIIVQSILLSTNYSWAYQNVERLFSDLKKKNKKLKLTLGKLKATQEKIIHHEKRAAIGGLSAGLAHEVRNQLNSISFLDFLKRDANEKHKKYINMIYDSRDRILSILDEVRALAKNEDTDYSLSSYSLSDLIDETLTIAKMDQDVKKVKIIVKSNIEISVMLNKHKLIQVLLNIIRNAAQAVGEKKDGQIIISTGVENESVIMKIIDNGAGIEKDICDKIWEPFFTTKGEHGTGIGLDICKRIINGHNGKIYCESIVNEGTTFTIELPYTQ